MFIAFYKKIYIDFTIFVCVNKTIDNSDFWVWCILFYDLVSVLFDWQGLSSLDTSFKTAAEKCNWD